MSKYMNMSAEKQAELKAKAKHRYHNMSGNRQRALQYLKALQVGLIQKCRESALEKHGIVKTDDGGYKFAL